MQRKYLLEPNAPSQLLLPTRRKPFLLGGPTKKGRAEIGEIGMETVPKGKRPAVASRRWPRKAAEHPRFQSRILTW